jgi:hypothetical protein
MGISENLVHLFIGTYLMDDTGILSFNEKIHQNLFPGPVLITISFLIGSHSLFINFLEMETF